METLCVALFFFKAHGMMAWDATSDGKKIFVMDG